MYTPWTLWWWIVLIHILQRMCTDKIYIYWSSQSAPRQEGVTKAEEEKDPVLRF